MALDFGKLDLRDALDLAILIEDEALERYQAFSKLVGGRYPGDAADVFQQMAGFEQKHGDELRARRRALFQDAPARVSMEMLDDVEAPDRGAPRRFMSARDAVEVALASEAKAWAFFNAALPQVKDPSVRILFEALRDEEAGHQALLKRRLASLPKGPDLAEGEADEPGSDGG
jgi:rubrerythrin